MAGNTFDYLVYRTCGISGHVYPEIWWDRSHHPTESIEHKGHIKAVHVISYEVKKAWVEFQNSFVQHGNGNEPVRQMPTVWQWLATMFPPPVEQV